MSWSSVSKSLLAVCVITEFAVIFAENFTCEHSLCINGDCLINGSCETSKSCFSQTQELKMPELSRSQTLHEKGCSPDECTELAFSATLGDQRTFRYDHRCCAADTCNQTDTQSSQVPAEANGVQCLACYMEAGIQCTPTLLNCTGSETKCVSVIGTDAGINSPPSIVMIGVGCATESACNLNMTVLKTVNIHSFCSSGFSVLPTSSPTTDSTGLPPTTSTATDSTGLQLKSFSAVLVLISLLLLKVFF
ncbi:protein RoBo-1-like [Arvicanthis niloticus]|uniref:protein RoBo-1-like n=1 Tax=Arvicanthis niloticus TaxID=61156 RepID=UPI0014862E15|nr:protein RoBo-1-like [Arvicanthis niloticus]